MANLLSTFTSLVPSSGDGSEKVSYFASPIAESSGNYIAKSEGGHPVVLIETCLPVGAYPASLKLENLLVLHGYSGTVKTPESEVTGVFSVVECRVTDPQLIGSFLRLTSHLLKGLAQLPEPLAVAIEIRKLVHIFQALRQPPSKSVQGLWAELFVLANSPDLPQWADAWHEDPMERYDFAMRRLRIEVKSSGSRMRRHHFSNEQLHPPNSIELWVASLFVERSSAGTDCIELLRRIQSSLSGDAVVKTEAKVMKALGLDYLKLRDFKFDDELAKDSLAFVPVASIPRISDELPDAVSEVRYAVLIPDSAHWQQQYPDLSIQPQPAN